MSITVKGYDVISLHPETQEKIYTWAKDENLGILHELIDGEYVLTEDTTINFDKTGYILVSDYLQ